MRIRTTIGLLVFLWAMTLATTHAQTYSVVKDFNGSDGQGPVGSLVLSGTALYGNTYLGGNSNWGTIFTLKTDGTGFNVLRHFEGPTHANGGIPSGNLILFGNTLFGTTEAGGSGVGTVFRMATNGTGYAVIYPFGFAGENGARPRSGLVVIGSTLYGTTYGKSTPTGYGTVFRLTTNGSSFTVLMDFLLFAPPGGGRNPYTGLTPSGTNLYGTTYGGGISTNGTVFRTSTNGAGFTTLKQFTGGDGSGPRTPLLLANGTLYGMTFNGGGSSLGTIYKLNVNGTGFAVLKDFSGSDGAGPLGGLLLISNYLYGTTYYGGASDKGVLFRIHTNGSNFSVIKEFGGLDGSNPGGGLVRSGNTLYGATYAGGSSDNGVIFALDLAPVVSITRFGDTIEIGWTAADGLEYQVQFKTALNQPTWDDLTGSIIATGPTPSTVDSIGPDQQRFYRVLLVH